MSHSFCWGIYPAKLLTTQIPRKLLTTTPQTIDYSNISWVKIDLFCMVAGLDMRKNRCKYLCLVLLAFWVIIKQLCSIDLVTKGGLQRTHNCAQPFWSQVGGSQRTRRVVRHSNSCPFTFMPNVYNCLRAFSRSAIYY